MQTIRAFLPIICAAGMTLAALTAPAAADYAYSIQQLRDHQRMCDRLYDPRLPMFKQSGAYLGCIARLGHMQSQRTRNGGSRCVFTGCPSR